MMPVAFQERGVVRSPVASATTIDAPHRPLRVLIVDDNHINLSVLSTLLRRRFSTFLDGSPVTVDSGLKALQLLRTHVFDLILMDIQMPFLSGLDATLRIRNGEDGVLSANRNAHIVAVTTAVGDDPEAAYRRAGMDGMIGKPVRFQDIQHYLCPLSREAHHAAISIKTFKVDDEDIYPPLPPVLVNSERVFYLPADATVRSPRPEICKAADFEKMLRAQTRASLRTGGALAIARSGSWSGRPNTRRPLSEKTGHKVTSDRISEEEDVKLTPSDSEPILRENTFDVDNIPKGSPSSPLRQSHTRPPSMTINKRTLSQQIAREMQKLDDASAAGSDSEVQKQAPNASSKHIRPICTHRTSSPAWITSFQQKMDDGTTSPRSVLPNNFVSASPTSMARPTRPDWLMALNNRLIDSHIESEFASKRSTSSSLEGSTDDSDALFSPPPFLDETRRGSVRSSKSTSTVDSTDAVTPESDAPDFLSPLLTSSSLRKNTHLRSSSSSSTETTGADDITHFHPLQKERNLLGLQVDGEVCEDMAV